MKKWLVILTFIGTIVTYGFWIDSRYAKSGDIKEIQQDIIYIRIDQLRNERRTLMEKKDPSPEDRRRIEDIDVTIERLRSRTSSR